jgi:hypothetical protein
MNWPFISRNRAVFSHAGGSTVSRMSFVSRSIASWRPSASASPGFGAFAAGPAGFGFGSWAGGAS